MVSRRKFFVIFLMMAVLLFLFQFSQVMRENWNHYSNNEYAYNNLPRSNSQWSAQKRSGMMAGSIPTVLYIGDSDSEIGKVVSQWCVYTKYNMVCENKLVRYVQVRSLPTLIFIDGESVATSEYLSNVESYMKYGIPVVFLSLPDVKVVESSAQLQKLLGISSVEKERIVVEGIRLFDGSLLGGEAIYQAQNAKEKKTLQDMDLEMPWYITGKGSKTYMIGMLNEKAYEREDFPRIIWRNSEGNSMVFAVNGDYMKSDAGFGFLDLFVYEMSDYALYPVINAQNTLMIDFPDFSGADEEAVANLYSRDTQSVQQDVFWPSIYSMIARNNLRPTCFFMTKYDQASVTEASSNQVNFYLQQINEVGAEAGRSMNYGEGMTLAKKIEDDSTFYRDVKCRYDFRAAYLEKTDEAGAKEWDKAAAGTAISTIAARAEGDLPLVSYYTDYVTLQDITQEADVYTYSQNLRTRSLLTSIGYSNMLIDFHRVLWPENKEDSWEVYFDKVYSNISTYWSKMIYFDQTTLSQSDYRVRNFLNLDYRQTRDGDTIYLLIRNGGEDCYFLLRTHEEAIASVQNGEYQKLEKDAYLIHATSSHLTIKLKNANEVLKYDGPFIK